MTDYQLLRRCARNWACVGSKQTRRHYQRQWLRAVNILGDRWLLAVQVEKKA
jgi:hypothetical protein